MNKLHTILIITSLIFCSSSFTHAQVVTDKTIHEFGDVRKEDPKYADFKLSNVSSINVKVLKYEIPYGVSIKFSNEIIEPDGSIMVRLKYTPKSKGNFEADVPIWFSSNSQPMILTIKGKAITFNINESLFVPDFNVMQEKIIDETFDLKLKVIKKRDASPVVGATLDVIWDGVLFKNNKTNSLGEIEMSFVPDKYYLIVRADSLGIFESEFHIHKNVKEFVVELGPQGTIAQVTADSAEVYETEIVEAEEKEVPIIQEEKKKIENPSFSNDVYLPNNIVFLIDVSVSMKHKGKMNLLKASMIELTDLLRSVDKVAIVTYSSNAEMALKSTSARNKQEIKNVIRNLEPKGSTSGQKGMKKAYQVLSANEIKGGNNQIFISTDGAFNLDTQDKGMLSIVKKNAKKGYKISVIGIKNEKWTVKNMKKIAAEGNGNYLQINNYQNAQKILVEEVKLQSRNNFH